MTFADIIKRLEKVSTPGKMQIDGKPAQIDGEPHKIDNYDELFRKLMRQLEK